jgi:type VI protein secretion system component VasF
MMRSWGWSRSTVHSRGRRASTRSAHAIADKQLERIRKAATATMFATASRKQTEETPYRRTMVIFIVLLLMMVLGLLGVKMVHDSRTQDAPPPRPPITKPAHP